MIDQIACFKFGNAWLSVADLLASCSSHNFTTSKPLATQSDTSIPTYSMTYRGQGQEHPPLAPSVHASTMDQCLQLGSHLMVISPLPSHGIMPSCATAAEYRAVSSPHWAFYFGLTRASSCAVTWALSASNWVKPFLGEQTILDHKMQFLILMNHWLIS